MAIDESAEGVERLADVLAELKADARTLSQDMVKGIYSFKRNAYAMFTIAVLAWTASIPILLPQFYTGFYRLFLVGILYFLTFLGMLAGYLILREYAALKRKYATLLAVANELKESA